MKIIKKIDKVDPLGITSFKIVGERRMAKFPKKLLGHKTRTQMVMHRLVVKFYENGITIKPWKSQGLSENKCPRQDEMFLTNENVEFLRGFLEVYDSAKKITENLDDKNKTEKEEGFTDEFGRSARYG